MVDESAPIYHVDRHGLAPILLIAADHEQKLLSVSAIKHFGCVKRNFTFKVMKNCQHCEYTSKVLDGGSRFISP